jgi:hypothetical protein
MLAGYDDIANYLLARALIPEASIVAGDLALVDASRRNSNVRVLSDAGPSYFLKQETIARGARAGSLGSVGYEARVYGLLQRLSGGEVFCRHLPRCYGFDERQQLLILEDVNDSINLADHHWRRGRFSSLIARRLGRAVALLHGLSEFDRPAVEAALGIPAGPPWVFRLPEPDQWLYLNSSASSLEFLKVLQKDPALCSAVDSLGRQWQALALIHGDLRWANCLLPWASARRARIRIVDWELARLGDPCWDIASVFSEYLSLWLSSIPISREAPPDRLLPFARFSLDRMHPAIRSFWAAYVEHRGIGWRDRNDWLLRSTSYAGVRLVQTAFERLQTSEAITDNAICALQLCANILSRPAEAAVGLLGLPLSLDGDDPPAL